MQTANKTKWQSTTDALPDLKHGQVLVMLPDSRIVKGRYYALNNLWVTTSATEGIMRRKNNEVRYWKPILQT